MNTALTLVRVAEGDHTTIEMVTRIPLHNELYMGMARLNVHRGPGAPASPSAATSPGRSPDKGGWGGMGGG